MATSAGRSLNEAWLLTWLLLSRSGAPGREMSICNNALTASASCCRCFSSGGVSASSQWMAPRKYSIDLVGTTSSIRRGIIGTPLLTARSISRWICRESLALAEKISTITRHRSIASMMACPYSWPGLMSRGAIQHRTPARSSTALAASAAVLSLLE